MPRDAQLRHSTPFSISERVLSWAFTDDLTRENKEEIVFEMNFRVGMKPVKRSDIICEKLASGSLWNDRKTLTLENEFIRLDKPGERKRNMHVLWTWLYTRLNRWLLICTYGFWPWTINHGTITEQSHEVCAGRHNLLDTCCRQHVFSLFPNFCAKLTCAHLSTLSRAQCSISAISKGCKTHWLTGGWVCHTKYTYWQQCGSDDVCRYSSDDTQPHGIRSTSMSAINDMWWLY